MYYKIPLRICFTVFSMINFQRKILSSHLLKLGLKGFLSVFLNTNRAYATYSQNAPFCRPILFVS